MRLQAVDVERAMERLDARSATRLGRVDWQRPIEHRLARAQQSLSSVHIRIEGLSPVRVLERGYAVVRDANGQVLRDSSQVSAGSVVSMSLARGSVIATVDAAHSEVVQVSDAEPRSGLTPTSSTKAPNESTLPPSVDALDQTVSESQEPYDD
jgi:hypothetical protein